MAVQMLIYQSAVPLSIARHGKCSIQLEQRYSFMRSINSVPIVAAEFAPAASEYVILFVPSGESLAPIIVLGVQNEQNLYLAPDDGWVARYVPAFVRRYPFVLSSDDDQQTFSLCVDEAFLGLNYLGKGEALFDGEGKPTPYVENVLQFQQEYRLQSLRTDAFCQKLNTLDILAPMQANFTSPEGESASLGGFLVVDRNKLKALGDDLLGEMVRSEEMDLIYLHLQSLSNFASLFERTTNAAKNPGTLKQNETITEPDSAIRPEGTTLQ